MKKTALVLALSIVFVSCLQSKAWSKPSLLLQLPSVLAAAKQGGTTTVNDNVTVIDESGSAEIVGSNTSAEGETELQLSGDLASSAQDGSILYLLPGADDRFPFGIAGKVVSASSNADGTKTVVLGEATYADVVKEASFNLDNIVLDASNFVGVIAPTAVEAASPMPSALVKSVSDGSVYSFRDGAVVVRQAADINGAMSSAAESGTIDAGTVSLNMKVDLWKMGVDASRMSPIDAQTSVGFVINGSLKNIKLTNEYDFSLLDGGLKSLNLRVDGDFDFDVKFNGKGSAEFGYFSQAWNEVKDESFKAFGVSAKLTGLSADDKIGKFPLAGLVWSVPCPNPTACPVLTGQTQTPLRNAKALGVIVWLYLTADGELSIDRNFTIAKLNQSGLSVGIKKPSGGDFEITRSLSKKSSSECQVELLKLDGTAGLQIQGGVTADIDFFTSGVRLANAGVDVGGLFKAEASGEAGYCITSLGSSGSWKGDMCYSGGIGYGLIARAAAKVGIEINTSWADVSGNREYEFSIPTNDEKDDPGKHGLWYYKSLFDTCAVPTVTSATGRVWMDRDLGASRVATSMTDTQAYGELYQWGRGKDGHEKRTSATTTTLSSSDNPGHDKFITTSSEPYDWRDPQNENLWQGVGGVNNPCPAGFRVPTTEEWQEEIDSWMSKDTSGAFASPLKLPLGGYRVEAGDFPPAYAGSTSFYWSSTADGSYAYGFGLIDDMSYDAEMGRWSRAKGGSIRCIKDNTAQVSTVVSATGRVWMDRNLGASRVATSSTDPQAVGDLYQWGRLSDGHEKWNSETTTTTSSSDVPGHGKFIVSGDWRDPENNNLWQGVDGKNNPCPSGFRLPTISELEDEMQYLDTEDANGAFNSNLKLTSAASRYYGNIAEGEACYWSSTISTDTEVNGCSLCLGIMDYYGTAVFTEVPGTGGSVRCIKD